MSFDGRDRFVAAGCTASRLGPGLELLQGCGNRLSLVACHDRSSRSDRPRPSPHYFRLLKARLLIHLQVFEQQGGRVINCGDVFLAIASEQTSLESLLFFSDLVGHPHVLDQKVSQREVSLQRQVFDPWGLQIYCIRFVFEHMFLNLINSSAVQASSYVGVVEHFSEVINLLLTLLRHEVLLNAIPLREHFRVLDLLHWLPVELGHGLQSQRIRLECLQVR